MLVQELILILSRLVVGAVATFLAILVWSKTRDSAWMLIVIGTVVGYGEAVLTALEAFGVVSMDALPVYGVSIVRVGFANLPTIFFAVAFIVVLSRRRF
jgi:hypothetical protein